MKHRNPHWSGRVTFTLLVLFCNIGLASAQGAEGSSSPAGLAMLVLFLGIAGMIGVLVIRWSQTTGEDDDSAG